MEMSIWVIAALTVWWTLAVAFFAILMAAGVDREFWLCIAVAVFWPAVAIAAAIVILWRLPFRTAAGMRADFKRRGVARDFEEFLSARRGQIVSKKAKA